MSLEKWAEYAWLKAGPTSRDEIKGLLTIIARDLKGARVDAISEDRRFEAAFSAIRTAGNVALRACGDRIATLGGQHVKTLESLEFTIQADAKLIRKLKAFSQKRNATSYDSAGNVSREELASAIKAAAKLQIKVVAWLEKNHPELCKP
jgi:hypothetical protein